MTRRVRKLAEHVGDKYDRREADALRERAIAERDFDPGPAPDFDAGQGTRSGAPDPPPPVPQTGTSD